VFWGGYSGYWADPDGHVWEVAMNPFWPLKPDGSLVWPGTVDRIEEMELTAADEAAIAGLLAACFKTDFGGRSYFRTRHHLRLVIREAGQIVAHVAVQFRAVRLGAAVVSVAGLADVACHPEHRGKGHAARLVQAAIERARQARAGHVLLFGTAGLYGAAGFVPVRNRLVYVEIDGARTGDMRREAVEDLQVLDLGDARWDSTAELDLMGSLF
jgi:predicted N-acetyltransferase YhbS